LCDRLQAVITARGTPVELASASLPITNLLHETGVNPHDFIGADRRLLAVASIALLIMPHTRPPVGPGTLGHRVVRELGMVAPPAHTDPKGEPVLTCPG